MPGAGIYYVIVKPYYLQLCICKFACSLKFICNPQINTQVISMVIHGHAENCKIFQSPDAHFPAEVKQGSALPSCFSSHTVKKCPYGGIFNATTFAFLCFWSVISLFEMAPSIVLKCCLVFLCTEGCNVPYGENTCYTSFVQT